MENPDQFRDLFRRQKALNERIGVKTDGALKRKVK
jgi:hypothetical protein